MLKTFLKFLFRLYVSFSNPAYIDWRKQLRAIVSRVLTTSDKRFIACMIVVVAIISLETIVCIFEALFNIATLKINTTAMVLVWFLSILLVMVAALIWLKGFFRYLFQFQGILNESFRRIAWFMLIAGCILNLVSLI